MPKLTEAKTVKQRTRGIKTEFTVNPNLVDSAHPAIDSNRRGFYQMRDFEIRAPESPVADREGTSRKSRSINLPALTLRAIDD